MPPPSGGFPCDQCPKICKSPGGLKQHVAAAHQQSSRLGVPLPDVEREFHPSMTARPCDRSGVFVLPGTPPIPPPPKSNDDWSPFHSRAGFELAELLYKEGFSRPKVDHLLSIWSATLAPHGDSPPITDHRDLYAQIDSIDLGFVPWKSWKAQYQGHRPGNSAAPSWMDEEYQLWYRDPRKVVHNILANPDFGTALDYIPYRDVRDGGRRYCNFMSGDWSWNQCDIIATDPEMHGCMFVPIILGSDKTTTSVATGQHEYHPVYLSIGNVHNNVRRAHKGALVLIGFLPIPKGSRAETDNDEFRDFKRRLFHGCLKTILKSFKQYTTKWDLVRCVDDHFRRVVYGIGPYIADYPEQVLIAGIASGWCPICDAPATNLDNPGAELRTPEKTEVLFRTKSADDLWFQHGLVDDFRPFTSDFPRANIHELLTPDLLHQAIKGTFKDHLVEWVREYLEKQHGPSESKRILDAIDRRISLAPPFPGLRRFKQGRNFQQWTGDDSKALMKVYVTALEGYVPVDITKTFNAFLDFCYIARKTVLTEGDLDALSAALQRFHHYRTIFRDTGVQPGGFSLPRQHALTHYRHHIQNFGAPNGLCSSITESKHIVAVKDPWRRSNRYNALRQMLKINTHNDKLAVARIDFLSRGMLGGTCLGEVLRVLSGSPDEPNEDGSDSDDEDDNGEDDNGEDDNNEDDNNEDDNGEDDDNEDDNGEDDDNEDDLHGPVDGPPILGEVKLASKKATKYPTVLWQLGQHIGQWNLEDLVSEFLFYQHNPEETPLPPIPSIRWMIAGVSHLSVFHSARAVFCAPNNPSGIGGMYCETIRSTHRWKSGGVISPRRDCIFLDNGSDEPGVKGLEIARVHLFFSFETEEQVYPCALVHNFRKASTGPDPDNGMWIIEPEYISNETRSMSVVHVDSIVRAAHLLPIFQGSSALPSQLNFSLTLDSFRAFYVNKYIDYHAFETVF